MTILQHLSGLLIHFFHYWKQVSVYICKIVFLKGIAAQSTERVDLMKLIFIAAYQFLDRTPLLQ